MLYRELISLIQKNVPEGHYSLTGSWAFDTATNTSDVDICYLTGAETYDFFKSLTEDYASEGHFSVSKSHLLMTEDGVKVNLIKIDCTVEYLAWLFATILVKDFINDLDHIPVKEALVKLFEEEKQYYMEQRPRGFKFERLEIPTEGMVLAKISSLPDTDIFQKNIKELLKKA